MSDTNTSNDVPVETNQQSAPEQQYTPEQLQYYQQQQYYYNYYKNNPQMNPHMNPPIYPQMNPMMSPPMYPQIYPPIYFPIIQPLSQPSLIPFDSSVTSTDKNMILSIVREDGKLICKKSYTCPFGMKCTNKECNDYHHPKVDLDIIKQSHGQK